MPDASVHLLGAWESFYVIVGSSAAGLTGLMFVVVTLLSGSRAREAAAGGALKAFSGPTVVHFCAALLVSAILSAPWDALWQAGTAIGATGLAGVLYGFIVERRIRRQTHYQTLSSDWFWYGAAPFIAYATLLIAAIA